MYIERIRVFLSQLDRSEKDMLIRRMMMSGGLTEDLEQQKKLRETTRKNLHNFIEGKDTKISTIESILIAIDELPWRNVLSILKGYEPEWMDTLARSAAKNIPHKYTHYFEDADIRNVFIKIMLNVLSICYSERKTDFEANLYTINQFFNLKINEK